MNEWAWKAATVGVGIALAGALGPPVYSLLRRLNQTRENYRGETIPTSAGVLFGVALIGLLAFAPLQTDASRRDLLATATAVGFCLLGLLDDRWGTSEFKGLRGHLRALTQGRFTTGLLKAAGGVGIAVVAAAQVRTGPALIAAALVIALSANAFNLLDLRPLRALKAFWTVSLAFGAVLTMPHALVLGMTLLYAREEGRRRVMLGDAGSNLLGAVVGATAAGALQESGLWTAAVLLLAFHLWAERHSLTGWIAARPWASAVDNWGVEWTEPPGPVQVNAEESSDGDASPTHG